MWGTEFTEAVVFGLLCVLISSHYSVAVDHSIDKILKVKDAKDTTELPVLQYSTSCKNASDCGESDDVLCELNTEYRYVCKCLNEIKFYVPKRKQCLTQCNTDKDCVGGRCRQQLGDLKFCSCYRGFSGDFCQISACEDLCGEHDDNIECRFKEETNKPYCVCTESKEGFDYDKKNCTECDCGTFWSLCEYRDGEKICQCDKHSYVEDGKCVDCNCGTYESSLGCEFKAGKKKCLCNSSYKLNNDTCQMCYCGWNSEKCDFQNGSKVCSCKKGYLPDNDIYCSECDCGSYGTCSFNEKNEKVCQCDGGYVEYKGTCKPCTCKGPTKDSECKFDSKGNIICNCSEGYEQLDSECKKCDCGKNGKCSFISSNGEKWCTCDSGYQDNKGMCEVCDCGGNGHCYFDYGKKICNCNREYQPFDGSCKECTCGREVYAYTCKFLETGEKNCTCQDTYALLDGVCKSCSECSYYTSCTYDNDGKRRCNCREGDSDNNGVCYECNCGPQGTDCHFDDDGKHCKCKSGYYDDRGYCRDIDECERPGSCPSTTKCVNLPGDYTCECLEGYKKKLEWDIRTQGCLDIDECKELSNACMASGAICINIPGSYRCDCMDGYKGINDEKKTEKPQYKKCIVDNRPYRTATIIFGVLFGCVAIAAVAFIIKRHIMEWNGGGAIKGAWSCLSDM